MSKQLKLSGAAYCRLKANTEEALMAYNTQDLYMHM